LENYYVRLEFPETAASVAPIVKALEGMDTCEKEGIATIAASAGFG